MFYRKDLLDAAGKKPPTTIAEYQALAKSFHSPMRAGTINCLKPVDAGLNEAHWYINALGQGNRANSTIGRAVQLTIRNVGGGRPGEVDRATHGNPGKISFCFAEDEQDSPFTPLAQWRGLPAGTNAVTVFAGEGPRGMVDQLARTDRKSTRLNSSH